MVQDSKKNVPRGILIRKKETINQNNRIRNKKVIAKKLTAKYPASTLDCTFISVDAN